MLQDGTRGQVSCVYTYTYVSCPVDILPLWKTAHTQFGNSQEFSIVFRLCFCEEIAFVRMLVVCCAGCDDTEALVAVRVVAVEVRVSARSIQPDWFCVGVRWVAIREVVHHDYFEVGAIDLGHLLHVFVFEVLGGHAIARDSFFGPAQLYSEELVAECQEVFVLLLDLFAEFLDTDA